VNKDALLCCTSLTGYPGGGKKMIAEYEADGRSPLLDAPRQYGLTQQHKHLKEMAAVCGLTHAPAFMPIVGDFYSGMEVSIPLFADQLNGNIDDVKAAYRAAYAGPVVNYAEAADEGGFLSAGALSGRDDMQVNVSGNAERVLLTARFDNLGKGASGAAIQNMNLLLGLDETEGLVIGAHG
jgi:N-acetyl-gamma-glutamyl-phosphate reductase